MKVLILDTTHGGEILSKKYVEDGNDVVCVDVYHVTPEETMEKIRHNGAVALGEVPKGDYDLVVMPCHCPDIFLEGCTYSERIYFSDAVNKYIDDRRFRIEITGVKGKTSTCFILANILDKAGRRVFLHSSRGQGPWKNWDLEIIDKKSIAPTSLLTLPKGDYDVMICEVSLGGSGKADIAGITNLLDNYGIAKNTRKAEEAKKAILTNKLNVVCKDELPIWEKYGKGRMVGYGERLKVIGSPKFGEPISAELDYGEKAEVKLSGSYLSLQYIEAMNMAVEICKCMNIEMDAVINGLESFKGVPGRGEIFIKDGVKHVKERNPGISALSVGRTLDVLEKMGALEDALMIVDPVSRKVCDKMKAEDIRKVADAHGVKMILTKGDGARPEIPDGNKMIIEFIKEGFQ